MPAPPSSRPGRARDRARPRDPRRRRARRGRAPARGRRPASARSASWVTRTRVRPGRGADQRPGQPAPLEVEVGVGLVEQQELRLVQDGTADRQPLAHPGRERVDPVRRRGAPSRPRSSSDSIRCSASPAPSPCSRAWKREVLAAAEVAVEEGIVAEIADPAAQLPGLGGKLAAEDARLAGARTQQAWRAPAAGSSSRRRWGRARRASRPRRARTRARPARSARRSRGGAPETAIAGPRFSSCSAIVGIVAALTSGPCAAPRAPTRAAGRCPRAGPRPAGRCGRRAGGPRSAARRPGRGRRGATRSRGSSPAPR